MKTVFVTNDIVVGHGWVPDGSVGAVIGSTDAAAVEYFLPDDSPVDVGWTCSLVDEGPVFSAPAATLPLLTPMTLYMAFTPTERIKIKASTDPLVIEFWAMYQLSVQLNKPTDPNLISVQEALAYLAAPVSAGQGAGILASVERVQQVLAGIPQ